MNEYKVNARGFIARYQKKCWAVERHKPNGSIKLIANYDDAKVATEVAAMLNSLSNFEQS